jgi:hypothetical protein
MLLLIVVFPSTQLTGTKIAMALSSSELLVLLPSMELSMLMAMAMEEVTLSPLPMLMGVWEGVLSANLKEKLLLLVLVEMLLTIA